MPGTLFAAELQPTGVRLRDYQLTAARRVREEFEAGRRSTLIVLPTGTGKTVTFGYIARNMVEDTGGRALVLAHRGELIQQAAGSLANLGLTTAVEQAGSRARAFGDPHVVIATVQTMQGKRLATWPSDYFDLIITDECVTGDTRIITEKGEIPIASIPTIDCRRVLSYNGSEAVWRDITAFLPKGERPVLEITTESGRSIRCTANHPIYTEAGWREAGSIRSGDAILSLAVADAAPCSAGTDGADNNDSCWGTSDGSASGRMLSGPGCSRKWSLPLRLASAVVASPSGRGRGLSNGSGPTEIGATIVSSKATTSGPRTGRSTSRPTSGRRSSALSSAIRASCRRILGARTLGFAAITGTPSGHGSSTRRLSSADFAPSCGTKRLAATESGPCVSRRPACPASRQSSIWSSETDESGSPAIGWTASATSGSPGGLATTAAAAGTDSSSTRRAIPCRKSSCAPTGSATATERRPSTGRGDITSSTSRPTPAVDSCPPSNPTFPSLCNTSFERVASVRNAGTEPVYDITVDDTHCFFANGLLAHNCHHAVADSYGNVYDHFAGVPHLGVTATADRGDKVNLGCVFESVAYEMTLLDAMTAPAPGPYLSRLSVVQCEVGVDLSMIRTTAGDLNAADLEEALKPHIEPIANAIRKECGSRPTLVFTPDVGSAQAIATACGSLQMRAAWVSGDDPQRDEKVAKYKAGEIQVLCNCSLLTEGFDAPATAAVVLCRPTKSRALYAQMIGRGTRLAPGKENCLIVDFAWIAGKHQLVKPVELLSARLKSDDDDEAEVMKRAQRLLDLGDEPDLLNAVEEARKDMESEKARREAVRLKVREREANYRRVQYDPLAGYHAVGLPTHFPKEARPMPATEKQIATLRKLGVNVGDDISRRRASMMLDVLCGRIGEGLASLKQVNHLVANGIDPATARSMSFADASAELDRIFGNSRRN